MVDGSPYQATIPPDQISSWKRIGDSRTVYPARSCAIERYMPALFSDSAPPRSILVICTGRIGDVLLATPVSRSLKARWPDAQIDMLVFSGTGGVLENNPDIRHVISVASRANLARRFAGARKIWRKYGLGCALRTSSAASLYCWMAGRKRIGVVAPLR
jgi:heptosyltransferase-3